MNYTVNPEWLFKRLEHADIRVIDCRFDLSNPQKGLENYLEGHIPGALYFDLDKDLSKKVEEHGGRHPLPNLTEFQDKLSAAGIDETITVVVYDDQGGPFASRFIWMLSYLGHEKVYLLNGGYSTWVNREYRISAEVPVVTKRNFQPKLNHNMLATMDEVKNKLHTESTVIIDSRELLRYQGLVEPIDKVAGHIPSAINYPWKDVSEKNGNWKDAIRQQERFVNIPKDKEIIVYCGSGVTACPNFLALKESGYENVKLYLGSWSDWITYHDNPVERDIN